MHPFIRCTLERGRYVVFLFALFALPGSAVATPSSAAAPPVPTRVSAIRPANVPDDYVVTPNGYFHPDCVHRIAAGERVRADGSIERANGSRTAVAPCTHARYSASGIRSAAAASPAGAWPLPDLRVAASTPPPEIAGYVVAGYFIDQANPPRELDASMVVPAAPADAQEQTIYLFPGLVDYENENTILQPVLAWNGFNDHAWTIASWNCCNSGGANHSDPVAVSPGDVIAGVMRGSNCGANLCTDWAVISTDQNTTQSTTLDALAQGQVFDWVFGAALEVYGVTTCAQYPASGHALFEAIQLSDMSGSDSYGIYPWVSWFPASILFIDGFEAATSNCPYGLSLDGNPPATGLRINWSN
ncbi:MAG TPA: hypothetical protein VGC55_00710 [Dokdonella sp.]